MKVTNLFIGKSAREIAHLIKDTTVLGLVEVEAPSEAGKKLEDLKKSISKPSANGFIVIAFKN